MRDDAIEKADLVLVSQQQPLIETFVRQPGDGWLLRPWKGVDGSVELRSVQLTIPLAEIDAGLEFDREEEMIEAEISITNR